MKSVKGKFKDGVILPLEPVQAHNGQTVLITFLEEEESSARDIQKDWEALMQLIRKAQVETGIQDLAHEHDHYLYGKPKKSQQET